MLLAGGSGSRLLPLTKATCKPVISYGGKYRIIDFVLSNCFNSKINNIGILIQSHQKDLSDYIGNGEPWGFKDELYILSSPENKEYCGTADAVFQNINYIKGLNPKYVLILSGDHVYNMDYQKLIEFHINKNAECTIAVKNVDLRDASRFGIMMADEQYQIYAFEEKPEKPNSTLASMGIYVFNTDVLINYLLDDKKDMMSNNDFGKNIIPKMVKAQNKIYAYAFDGFWKDVGTLYSLWDSNMNLLDKTYECPYDQIYTRTNRKVNHIDNHYIRNSLVADNTNIKGNVINSVISENVRIEKGSEVINSVILDNCVIGENSIVENAIIDHDIKVDPNIIIGGNKELTVIGSGSRINKNIKPGTVFSK